MFSLTWLFGLVPQFATHHGPSFQVVGRQLLFTVLLHLVHFYSGLLKEEVECLELVAEQYESDAMSKGFQECQDI